MYIMYINNHESMKKNMPLHPPTTAPRPPRRWARPPRRVPPPGPPPSAAARPKTRAARRTSGSCRCLGGKWAVELWAPIVIYYLYV